MMNNNDNNTSKNPVQHSPIPTTNTSSFIRFPTGTPVQDKSNILFLNQDTIPNNPITNDNTHVLKLTEIANKC
jgi:hypothetical protein